MDVRQGSITVGELEVGYLACGDSGPLALCLHGFPDSAWTWRHLLPELGAAGYRAVAPWLRGYAPTSVPADGRYQAGVLALDACGLHEALGGDADAVIVGHDWGAIATYVAINHEPDRWRRAVTMAVPPLGVMATAFLQYAQLKRSWYMFFFQHPLSDVAVGLDDLAFIDGLWRDWSPGYDASEDLPHVKDALRGPDNLAAALAYYRAMLGDGYKDPAVEPVDALGANPPAQPVLYLHGADDGCLGVDLVAGAAAFLPAEGSRVEVVDGAGHFLHVERPDVVNPMVVEFLTSTSRR
jgi:pimeloyl-ACP methyl ester carboxylesterase